MTKQFLAIKKDYLCDQKYQTLAASSRALNKKYGELCDLFQREYQYMVDENTESPYQMARQRYKENKKTFLFISQLKEFILEFLGIIKEMSGYQILCMQNLKENNQSQLLQITPKIIQKVRENKVLNDDICAKTNSLYHTYAQIKKQFVSFQQDMQNPVLVYQPQLVSQGSSKLKERIQKDWRIIGEIVAEKDEVQNKIEQFQPYLSTFKKKLIKNKYSVLKKIIYLTKNSKNASIEIFDALRCVATGRLQKYVKAIQLQSDDISFLKDYLKRMNEQQYIEHFTEQNKKWQKVTSLSISQFEYTFEEIQLMFQQLITHFNYMVNKFGEQHDRLRNLIREINEFYQEHQSPYILMKELLDIQDYFRKKVSKITVKVQQIQAKLKVEKNSCKKHSELLLTIIRVNKGNYKSFFQNFNKNKQLDDIIEKISFRSTKTGIKALYQQFINIHVQLLAKFGSQVRPRRQTRDSMEISHTVGQHYNFGKKIPLKNQVWLWREWRYEIEINFESYNDYFKEIQKYIQKIVSSTQVKDSVPLQQFKGLLLYSGKGVAGDLYLKMNALQFSSDSLKVCIPWKEISNFAIKNKVFGDILIIETQRGHIHLVKFQNLQAIIDSMKEAQEKSLMGNKKKVERKPEIILSQQQLIAITERKPKIQSEIPDMKDWTLAQEQVLTSWRIDEIYELFYSDRMFNFYGKEEPCFFSYTGKKAGNYNWIAEKFDKPGPEFYSLNKEVNFTNCCTFSTRKITFNHPLKPTPIPFMPKFCLNTDSRKIYWISHQQFLYVIQSETAGVPLADCFFTTLAHRLKKVEGGVKVEVFYYLKWVKDTMWKSTVESNAIPQIKENMIFFVNEMKKVLTLMSSLQRGEVVEIEKEKEESQVESTKPPDEVSKLKLHNKVLIAAFVLLVVVNLIVWLIF